jgi:hypothetical protein
MKLETSNNNSDDLSRCYVGNGPTAQVWRSCNHRLLSTSSVNPPVVAYLHESPPPKVHSLSTTDVANLSKDNALKLLTSASPVSTSSDFENIDGDEVTDKNRNVETLDPMIKASSNLSNSTQIFYNEEGSGSGSSIKNKTIKGPTARQSRRFSLKPTFTVVEVRSSSTNSESKTK